MVGSVGHAAIAMRCRVRNEMPRREGDADGLLLPQVFTAALCIAAEYQRLRLRSTAWHADRARPVGVFERRRTTCGAVAAGPGVAGSGTAEPASQCPGGGDDLGDGLVAGPGAGAIRARSADRAPGQGVRPRRRNHERPAVGDGSSQPQPAGVARTGQAQCCDRPGDHCAGGGVADAVAEPDDGVVGARRHPDAALDQPARAVAPAGPR